MPQPTVADLPAGHQVLWNGHLAEVIEHYTYQTVETVILQFASGGDGHVQLTDDRLEWDFPNGDASAWI